MFKIIPSITKALKKEFERYKVQQTPQEIKWLLEKYVDLDPRIVVEIGSKYGGSAKLWYDFMTKGKIISIDKNKDKWTWNPNLNVNKTLIKIHGNSELLNTIQKLNFILDGSEIDFLFIDGSYHYKIVSQNFWQYKEFVRTGGIIVFHNIFLRKKDPISFHNDELEGSITKLWYELVNEFINDYYWYNYDPSASGLGIIYV